MKFFEIDEDELREFYPSKVEVQVLGRFLIDNNISISSCESATGGAFASKLVTIPGISQVFDRSLVTYSWKAKIEELGVNIKTLEKYTAESHQIGREMVEGLYRKTLSKLCISVTGVAGPTDMDENRKAGTAYIGITYREKTKIYKVLSNSKSRDNNRKAFVDAMISLAYRQVSENVDR